ncbi:protocadherin-11 X-linked [Phyllostomus hastatus]|uniref:protocadherin-11 X-linked n=1 Tax=Phyllostomus hastatus TaxID=9423 RepID=UPI001E681D72|nr:protocadherin-11 X-linked [Phyllostomus hastatus]
MPKATRFSPAAGPKRECAASTDCAAFSGSEHLSCTEQPAWKSSKLNRVAGTVASPAATAAALAAQATPAAGATPEATSTTPAAQRTASCGGRTRYSNPHHRRVLNSFAFLSLGPLPSTHTGYSHRICPAQSTRSEPGCHCGAPAEGRESAVLPRPGHRQPLLLAMMSVPARLDGPEDGGQLAPAGSPGGPPPRAPSAQPPSPPFGHLPALVPRAPPSALLGSREARATRGTPLRAAPGPVAGPGGSDAGFGASQAVFPLCPAPVLSPFYLAPSGSTVNGLIQRLSRGQVLTDGNTGSAAVPQNRSFLSRTYIFAALLVCITFQSGAQMKQYFIQEELPDNILIGNLMRDLNLTLMLNVSLKIPLNFKLVYKLGELPLVRIQEDTGDIFTTNVNIDREVLCPEIVNNADCFYEVEVAILPDEIFKLVKIRFVIEDINDNAPSFPTTIINITVPENSLIGSRYSVPAASDADIGINGVQNYSLLAGRSAFGLGVGVAPDGQKVPQLVVLKQLDREEKDVYIMKLKVEDGGMPQRSSTAILQVKILDVNDNHPVFAQDEIEVNIPENAPVGASVVQLHATDADIGENAIIHFYFSNLLPIQAKRLFDLNSKTGLITIKQPLDREESPSHKLLVWASDGGLSPARALVRVNVLDVNDNAPSIDIRYIVNPVNGTVVLSENAPVYTKIALITVTDKDAGNNGRVICFMDQNVPFRLRPVFTNQFLLETNALLDFEATKEYAIQLMATDAGQPPLNQSSMLLIKVKDENDNAPVFTQRVITTSIPENNSPGSQVTKVTATDADAGRNGEISYVLGADAPPEFELDYRTGMLTAVTALDREKQGKYHLTVLAKDNGVPPLVTNATVIVRVLDQNDNVPVFSHEEYNFYVPENLSRHGTVGLINVSDLDDGENSVVTLSIVGVNDEFTIDPQTGVIRPNVSFDREKQESYTFYVKAQDGGRVPQSATAKVTINVVDVNDNVPVFVAPSSNYSFQLVLPSTDPGTVVFTVRAVDNDTGINAQLLYTIVEGNARGLFVINETTGDITMKNKAVRTDRGLHRLVVKANDLGQPDALSNVVVVNLFVNESVSNATLIHDLVRKKAATPAIPDIEITDASSPSDDYLKIVIATAVASTAVALVIVIIVIVRCYQPAHLKAAKKSKQSSEWVTPNPENRQMSMLKKKKQKKKKQQQQQPPKNLLLHFVNIEDSKSDDADDDGHSTTIDLPTELEEETMRKYDWGTVPTTFKPDSPDLARHYQSTSPQPAFQIQPETPLSSKHHFIQELPLDNTFVAYDSISKCSSSSSDPYSVSECSFPLTTFKDVVSVHARPPTKDVVRARTPMRETTTTVEILVHPEPQQKSEGKKAGKSQRRVTFHLPEGSQESGSEGGPGELEAAGGAHALPLHYRRGEDFYRAAPSSRTEGDGNSDPECTFIPGLKKAAEITVQPTLEEVSDTCTQECLILGHSDACWMPAALTRASPLHVQAAVPRHSPPLTLTSAHHQHRRSPPAAEFISLSHSPPLPASAHHASPPPGQAAAPQHSPAQPTDESAEGIALKTFTAGRQARAPRDDEHPF